MQVQAVGEFALIARLQQRLPPPQEARVVCGIGDDCAVLRLPAGSDLLLTTDTQEEEVHFRRAWATPEDIGWRCLAVNVSDIAAMGGMPVAAVVALSLPPDLEVAFVEGLYDGLQAVATAYSCPIVGGNVSKTAGKLAVTISVLGEVPRGQALRRSGARVGDEIWVTGTLGEAKAGLEALRHAPRLAGLATERVCERYRRPRPRLHEAWYLREHGGLHSLIDLSDGLSSDLAHICQASGVGAVLEAAQLPLAEETRRVAAALGADPLAYALHGGEDFELCFTAPPGRIAPLQADFTRRFQCPLTRVGYICAGRGVTLQLPDGRCHPLPVAGYDHFQAATP
ncbi:MAG: thiamine-monophosphate kinase [Candidatus Tectimicrobiota bacterium]|nr:MAG: thiamine-monophosphate kinase [Candidatus Tectomicrobia bacterium]